MGDVREEHEKKQSKNQKPDDRIRLRIVLKKMSVSTVYGCVTVDVYLFLYVCVSVPVYVCRLKRSVG